MPIRYIISSRKKQPCTEEYQIVGVAGDFGYLDTKTVHDHIKSNRFEYFTYCEGERDEKVLAAGDGPNRYILTTAHRYKKNNLVNLPDCYD